jgi:hypothetical protein
MLLHKLQQLLRASGCFQLYCQTPRVHPALSCALRPQLSCCAVCPSWALALLALLWAVLTLRAVRLPCSGLTWPVLAVVLAACPAHCVRSIAASSAVLILGSWLAAAGSAAARGWVAALGPLAVAAGVVVPGAVLLGTSGPFEFLAVLSIAITGCSIAVALGLAEDWLDCPAVPCCCYWCLQGPTGLEPQQPRAFDGI